MIAASICGLLAVILICLTKVTCLTLEIEHESSGRKSADSIRLAQHLEADLATVKDLKEKVSMLMLKNGLQIAAKGPLK